jgi:acyl-CoA thioester hydrolase
MVTKTNLASDNFNWFDHPIEVFPNNTDYGNIVWHGTYLIWMEEARVKCLSSIGVNFADFVASGVDMPVVEIKSLKYFHPLHLGEKAVVKTRVSFQHPRGKRGIRKKSYAKPETVTLYCF